MMRVFWGVFLKKVNSSFYFFQMKKLSCKDKFLTWGDAWRVTRVAWRMMCDKLRLMCVFWSIFLKKVNSSFSFLPDEKLSCEDKLRQAPKLINVDKPRCRVSTSFPFDDLKSRWEKSGNGNINKGVKHFLSLFIPFLCYKGRKNFKKKKQFLKGRVISIEYPTT